MKNFSITKMAGIVSIICAAIAIAASAQTVTRLASFDETNGENPDGTLVQGTNGNFYGTTFGGGENSSGTVFEVTPTGKLTTLYNFCSQANCADGTDANGYDPNLGLLLAADGNFYGTMQYGGANAAGTVFKITPRGELTTLYSFCAQISDGLCADGAFPSTLVQGANGNFYGVTGSGGNTLGPNLVCYADHAPISADGCGTAFEITPAGKLTTLYNFCSKVNAAGDCTDGEDPGGLIMDPDGNLYGAAGGGDGGSQFDDGGGIVFKMTPTGKLTTLYNFCSQTNCADGAGPGLQVQAANGNFYGTTSFGGTYNSGTFFEITPEGTLTTIESLKNLLDLMQGTDENFYGTAGEGAHKAGSLFKLTAAGKYTQLYSFCSQPKCADGSFPGGGLVQGTDGNFYGTTHQGGNSAKCGKGCGTVFSLSVGLGPFVRANPTLGQVGLVVNILGNNLTGTISVTFSGTAAKFEVISDSHIRAQVPGGATTGTIEVTTPSGTLESNVPFHVLP
jgi:uncharacterized repeat protein (TIGR03803 family)